MFNHSAERADTYGVVYLGPLDMIAFTFLRSFVLVIVAGVAAEAATIYKPLCLSPYFNT